MNLSIRRLMLLFSVAFVLPFLPVQKTQAAEVFFNEVYKGELNATIPTYPTESNQIFISLASKLVGTNFSFESLNGALEPTYSGNNVSGYLKYIDANGNAVSIRGVVSRPTKSGSVYEGFYFYVSDNLDNPLGDAYLLVIPGKESLFPDDGSIGTSSDPVDAALNDLLLLPRLSLSGTLSAFSSCAGAPSASQTLTATGYNLTAPIVVTAPTGYEVSATGASGPFSSTVNIPTSGPASTDPAVPTITTATVYVRLAATATTAASGNINFSSTGAAFKLVSTGTATVNALPTVSVSPASPSIIPSGSVSLTASGASTYSWSPSTGLSATTGATVTANPGSSTTYTVTGTDGNG